MGWRSLWLALLVGTTLACADPTAIDVSVYSEVPCSAQAEVALSVAGDTQSLATAAPAAVATQCDDLGDGTARRGSVVLVPQGDHEKAIAFQLTTRDDAQPLDSCAADPKGCIAARRQLRFQSKKTLEVRVDLRLSCLGVACPQDQTCVRGTCVPAQLPPCSSCGEPDGGAGPPAPTGVVAVAVIAGAVTTLAGSGNAGYAEGTGAAASFNVPYGIAVDSAGNVYVGDSGNNRIRKVTSAGVVTTLAGSSAFAYADGTGAAAAFAFPAGVAVAGSGDLYVADELNHLVRRVTSAGVVTTLAGSGSAAFADGAGLVASFNNPFGVAVDAAGNVYVGDRVNNRIRKVTSAGSVTTLSGSSMQAYADGTGAMASFYFPEGVAVDGAGNVYVADEFNHRIRAVTSAGVVTTLAGSGGSAFADGMGSGASFNFPAAVAIDGAGNLYVADEANQRIRRVTSGGVVSTLAGSGNVGRADGIGAAATFNVPKGVAVDGAGDVYVADTDNNLIRKVIAAGAGRLLVSWTGVGGSITYTASASAAFHPTGTCTTVATSCTISGLTTGVAYDVSVTATDASGTSPPSPAVVATPN